MAREPTEKEKLFFNAIYPLLQKVDSNEERVLVAWSIMADAWEQLSFMAKQDPGPSIACRRGCSYCCRINVDVGWVEAAVIAAEVMAELPELEPVLRAEAQARAGKEPAEIFGRACVFLAGGECMIYEHRPMICRGYSSLDVGACAGGVHAQVPSVEELLVVAKTLAGLLIRFHVGRPADAPLGGELSAMVVSEIDRQRAAPENPDSPTVPVAAEP
jgi:hypothetical protein